MKWSHEVKNLNRTDEKLLSFIQETYLEIFRVSELPLTLTTKIKEITIFNKTFKISEKAAHAPSLHRFDIEHWRGEIGNEVVLRDIALQIISNICSYQSEHIDKHGKITKNHRGDPSILVMEVIKEHMVKISETSETEFADLCKPDSILKKLVDFLRAIISRGNMFPQSNNPKRSSRMEVFTTVHFALGCLLEDLELFLMSTSSYMDLKRAIQHSKQLLEHGVRFLHYLLRKSDMGDIADVRSLRNPIKELDIKHKNHYIGQLLQHLLDSPAFLILYPNRGSDNSSQTDILLDENNGSIFPISESEFFSHHLNNNIRNLREQILDPRTTPTASGVQIGCSSNEIIMKVIFLHGLIEELGTCIVNCMCVFENAKDGGDLLVYGILNRTVAKTADNTIYYINKTRQALKDLILTIEPLQRYYMAQKQSKKIQFWTVNFSRSQKACDLFNALADDCISALGQVQSKAERGMSKNDMARILDRMVYTVKICKRVTQRRKAINSPHDISHNTRRLPGRSSLPLLENSHRIDVMDSNDTHSESRRHTNRLTESRRNSMPAVQSSSINNRRSDRDMDTYSPSFFQQSDRSQSDYGNSSNSKGRSTAKSIPVEGQDDSGSESRSIVRSSAKSQSVSRRNSTSIIESSRSSQDHKPSGRSEHPRFSTSERRQDEDISRSHSEKQSRSREASSHNRSSSFSEK